MTENRLLPDNYSDIIVISIDFDEKIARTAEDNM